MDTIFDFLWYYGYDFLFVVNVLYGLALNPMESSMAGDTGIPTGSESDSGAGTEKGAIENVDMQAEI